MPAPTRKSAAPAAVRARAGAVAPVVIKGDGASKKKAAVADAALAAAAKGSKGKGKKAPVPFVQKDEDEEDEEDEDFEDVDSEDEDDDISISDASDASAEGTSERGLKRLIEALGEDGLDEDELAELAALQDGEDDEDDEDDGDEDDDEDDGDEDDDEDDEEEDEDEEEEIALPTNGSGSKDTLAASLARSGLIPQAVDEDDEEEEEEDEEDEDEDPDASAIPLESLDDAAYASLPDAVRSSRFHREKINNRPALSAVRDLIALDGPYTSASGSSQKKMDWIEHMSLSWDHSVASELEAQGAAADDDLKRELVFYKQALSAAQLGRQRVLAAGMPFSRPDDFFAEMVKSDSHMERVRQTLLDERAGIKASEEAKRQRELKKFGKKVQVQKGLERQKNKKEMEEKIQGLKRKRGGVDAAGEADGDDAFDIRIENALQSAASSSSSARGRGRGGATSSRGDSRGRGRGGGKMPRTARDDKFGFGGKKRFSKSNTRESTEAGYGKYEGAGRGGGGGGGRGGRGGARGGRGGRGGGRGGSSRLGKSKRK